MVLIFTDNRGGGIGDGGMFLNKIFFSYEAEQRVKSGRVSYVSLK